MTVITVMTNPRFITSEALIFKITDGSEVVFEENSPLELYVLDAVLYLGDPALESSLMISDPTIIAEMGSKIKEACFNVLDNSFTVTALIGTLDSLLSEITITESTIVTTALKVESLVTLTELPT